MHLAPKITQLGQNQAVSKQFPPLIFLQNIATLLLKSLYLQRRVANGNNHHSNILLRENICPM